ncbi:MAG: cobyrinate a,c-diamide synthase [Alphaproteobacteria bacterium]|nr:cobyrinate a,c-diamide synthase [Alphaproteobacteria bacterium]MDE2041949.1 cobyrinate a,c-diamide synthase [Alphaproteobacteria bacterium]MDE2339668.1 cobyrinate a,c-diamide synthase [Alphaproteobacteria bacterium]
MKRVFISALAKSSGKTTVAVGLTRALVRRGLNTAPFKKGPDYIDPLWLSGAAGRACYNLDFNTQTHDEILATLAAAPADIQLIEGNKGLHDGVALDGADSSAALAKLTRAPVLLVANAEGLERGLAPLIAGVTRFDPDVCFLGLVLNKVGTLRQTDKLRAAIERYTDLKLLGVLPRGEGIARERHLGLVPPQGNSAHTSVVDVLADKMEAGLDVTAIVSAIEDVSGESASFAAQVHPSASATIAIPRDAAFCFYYADDLDALRQAGARLTFFDALRDTALPDCDGLLIGGGFPECTAGALAANSRLKSSIRDAINAGLPAYAECGGLMYLSRNLIVDGIAHPMCGVLDLDMVMEERPVGRGLVELVETDQSPWPGARTGRIIHAHEFHHARAINIGPDAQFAYTVARGYGITGQEDGMVRARLLASFAHLRTTSAHRWTDRFMALVNTAQLSTLRYAS